MGNSNFDFNHYSNLIMSSIIDAIKAKATDAGNYLKSNPDAARTLAAVGGTAALSGLAGGYLSSGSHNPAESPAERRKRILLTALATAAAGGGATYMGMKGMENISNPLPDNDVSPLTQMTESLPARVGMAGVGFAGLRGPWMHKGVRAAEAGHATQRLNELFESAKTNQGISDRVGKATFTDLFGANLGGSTHRKSVEGTQSRVLAHMRGKNHQDADMLRKLLMRGGYEIPDILRAKIPGTNFKVPARLHELQDATFGGNLPGRAKHILPDGRIMHGYQMPRWAHSALGLGIGFAAPEILNGVGYLGEKLLPTSS